MAKQNANTFSITVSDSLDCDVPADVIQALLGISHETLRRCVNDGTIIKSARGKYRLLVSVQTYTAHLREIAAGRGGEDDQAILAKERALLTREQRLAVELRNGQARGELVTVTEVRREWGQIIASARSILLSIPGRCRAALPHLSTHDVDTIDRITRRLLEDMARDRFDAAAATEAGHDVAAG